MNRQHNASLRSLNTLGIDAVARTLSMVDSADDLAHRDWREGCTLLGGGSNVVLKHSVYEHVIIPRFRGFDIVGDHDGQVLVRAGAGAVWHDLVMWCVKQSLWGVENLALIWGSVGAAPMQNIGAYGVELADCFESLEAWHLPSGQHRTFLTSDCQFAYRDSWFKHQPANEWLISSLTLRLQREPAPRLEYAGVAQAVACQSPTPLQVATAISELRRRKLPDPTVIANAGSFFKNPVVDAEKAKQLQSEHPSLPCFGLADGRVKTSAAAMIDLAGLKGFRRGPVGVSEQHALVLVNHGAGTGEQVLQLAAEIKATVLERFGVTLEIEPVLL